MYFCFVYNAYFLPCFYRGFLDYGVSVPAMKYENLESTKFQPKMRQILLLLALVGCTLPAVHKVQLKKITPPMVKMLRNGTWAKHVEEMRKQRNYGHDVSCIRTDIDLEHWQSDCKQAGSKVVTSIMARRSRFMADPFSV